MKTKNLAAMYAIAAASLYAIHVPFSKMLLGHVEPTMMAAFLYLGAGLGMLILGERPGIPFYAALAVIQTGDGSAS